MNKNSKMKISQESLIRKVHVESSIRKLLPENLIRKVHTKIWEAKSLGRIDHKS